MLAIIGGTGLTKLANLTISRRQVVRTPYGEPSGALTFGNMCGHDVVFLARHGYGHTIPPHEVNYRANLWALKECGAQDIVSVATVGGISADMAPGMLAVPDQIIDYTWGREGTFFVSGPDRRVTHFDFTWPYCEAMRDRCMRAMDSAGEKYVARGIYATSQGPRLETAAEINRMERDGATMVGMTGMPEAILARELDVCYAAIAVSVNYAAGRGTSSVGITFDEIEPVIESVMARVRRVLEFLVAPEDCDGRS